MNTAKSVHPEKLKSFFSEGKNLLQLVILRKLIKPFGNYLILLLLALLAVR